jgi:hypothetical protein
MFRDHRIQPTPSGKAAAQMRDEVPGLERLFVNLLTMSRPRE